MTWKKQAACLTVHQKEMNEEIVTWTLHLQPHDENDVFGGPMSPVLGSCLGVRSSPSKMMGDNVPKFFFLFILF